MKLPAMPVKSGRDATMNFDKLAKQIPTFVNVLPSQPSDGQEVYFQAGELANQGLVWHLRYNAQSPLTNKWEFVGGSEWLFLGGDITTASTVNVALTGGPTFSVPVSGVYWIDLAAVFISTAAGGFILVAFQNNTETSAIALTNLTTALEVVVRGRPWIATINKGEVVSLAVRSTAGVSCRFVNCMLSIRPIRVG